MIQLSGLQPFASGDNRLCFVHPGDASLCVKINRPDNTPEMRREKRRGWYRPLSYYDENSRDARSLAELEKFYGDGPFPKRCGWVDTDLGRGLAMELVRDADGAISSTLEHYLLRVKRVAEVRAALVGLLEFFAREGCALRGLNPHNLVARDTGEGFQLVAVDNLRTHALSLRCRAVARRRACHVMRDLQDQMETMRQMSKRLRALIDLPIPFM